MKFLSVYIFSYAKQVVIKHGLQSELLVTYGFSSRRTILVEDFGKCALSGSVHHVIKYVILHWI